MAGLARVRTCQMYCPVKGCPDRLPLPVETIVSLANGREPNTLTCAVEVIPDATAIWEHLRNRHGLPSEVE